MNELEYGAFIKELESKETTLINEFMVNCDKIIVKNNDLLRKIFIDTLIDKLTGKL